MAAASGLRLSVRLTPKARRERIDGVVRLADGTAAVKAAVTAPPADGHANEALLWLLAKELGVPRSALSLAAGSKSRSKIVHIAGDADILLKRLRALFAPAAQEGG